jgi:clan AA aspartic protease (TIGR02281 family)
LSDHEQDVLVQRYITGFSIPPLLSGLVLGVLLLGVAIGWWLRDSQTDDSTVSPAVIEAERVPQKALSVKSAVKSLYDSGALDAIVDRADLTDIVDLIESERSARAIELATLYQSRYGENYSLLMSGIGILNELKDYATAIEWVKRADLAALEPVQQVAVIRILEHTVDAYASELMASNRIESVVSLYQDITFTMPELPAYFLRLGTLQVQAGDFEAALTPLSLIQNHSGYEGRQARDLIAQIEQGNVHGEAQWQELPLTRNGNQFVVEARLDGQHPVRLLVDTGAAMTVIDDKFVSRIGYNLSVQAIERFTTANGVVEAPVLTVQELALGGSVVKVLTIGALTLDMPNGIHGLLGMNFLRHFDFRIDQNRGVLQLSERHR